MTRLALALAAALVAMPAAAQHAGHGAPAAQETAATREFRITGRWDAPEVTGVDRSTGARPRPDQGAAPEPAQEKRSTP